MASAETWLSELQDSMESLSAAAAAALPRDGRLPHFSPGLQVPHSACSMQWSDLLLLMPQELAWQWVKHSTQQACTAYASVLQPSGHTLDEPASPASNGAACQEQMQPDKKRSRLHEPLPEGNEQQAHEQAPTQQRQQEREEGAAEQLPATSSVPAAAAQPVDGERQEQVCVAARFASTMSANGVAAATAGRLDGQHNGSGTHQHRTEPCQSEEPPRKKACTELHSTPLATAHELGVAVQDSTQRKTAEQLVPAAAMALLEGQSQPANHAALCSSRAASASAYASAAPPTLSVPLAHDGSAFLCSVQGTPGAVAGPEASHSAEQSATANATSIQHQHRQDMQQRQHQQGQAQSLVSSKVDRPSAVPTCTGASKQGLEAAAEAAALAAQGMAMPVTGALLTTHLSSAAEQAAVGSPLKKTQSQRQPRPPPPHLPQPSSLHPRPLPQPVVVKQRDVGAPAGVHVARPEPLTSASTAPPTSDSAAPQMGLRPSPFSAAGGLQAAGQWQSQAGLQWAGHMPSVPQHVINNVVHDNRKPREVGALQAHRIPVIVLDHSDDEDQMHATCSAATQLQPAGGAPATAPNQQDTEHVNGPYTQGCEIVSDALRHAMGAGRADPAFAVPREQQEPAHQATQGKSTALQEQHPMPAVLQSQPPPQQPTSLPASPQQHTSLPAYPQLQTSLPPSPQQKQPALIRPGPEQQHVHGSDVKHASGHSSVQMSATLHDLQDGAQAAAQKHQQQQQQQHVSAKLPASLHQHRRQDAAPGDKAKPVRLFKPQVRKRRSVNEPEADTAPLESKLSGQSGKHEEAAPREEAALGTRSSEPASLQTSTSGQAQHDLHATQMDTVSASMQHAQRMDTATSVMDAVRHCTIEPVVQQEAVTTATAASQACAAEAHLQPPIPKHARTDMSDAGIQCQHYVTSVHLGASDEQAPQTKPTMLQEPQERDPGQGGQQGVHHLPHQQAQPIASNQTVHSAGSMPEAAAAKQSGARAAVVFGAAADEPVAAAGAQQSAGADAAAAAAAMPHTAAAGAHLSQGSAAACTARSTADTGAQSATEAAAAAADAAVAPASNPSPPADGAAGNAVPNPSSASDGPTCSPAAGMSRDESASNGPESVLAAAASSVQGAACQGFVLVNPADVGAALARAATPPLVQQRVAARLAAHQAQEAALQAEAQRRDSVQAAVRAKLQQRFGKSIASNNLGRFLSDIGVVVTQFTPGNASLSRCTTAQAQAALRKALRAARVMYHPDKVQQQLRALQGTRAGEEAAASGSHSSEVQGDTTLGQAALAALGKRGGKAGGRGGGAKGGRAGRSKTAAEPSAAAQEQAALEQLVWSEEICKVLNSFDLSKAKW